MLRFAEEIILILLDDEDGRFVRIPRWSLNYALAGGILMDLAMENRIDTDLENLILVDSSPVGDSLLDPALAEIAASEQKDTRYWLEHLAEKGPEVREEALNRLVNEGILERQDDRFMWMFRSRRYPMVDGQAEREVKLRIMEVLFSEMIPGPRDIMIICLVDACGIFRELLSKRQLGQVAGRIEQVRKLDIIGQAMSQAIRDIELTVISSMQPHLY